VIEGIYSGRRHLGTKGELRKCKEPSRKVQRRVEKGVKIGKKRRSLL